MSNKQIGLQKMYDKVFDLLDKYPKYRDNDELLVARVWWDELEEMGINREALYAEQLLQLKVDGRLAKESTITRARRKAQEEHPRLKGVTSNFRHNKAETVKEEVRQVKTKSEQQAGSQMELISINEL